MGVSLVQWLAVAALCGLVRGGEDLQEFFSASSYEYTLNLDLDTTSSTGFSGEAILNLRTAKEVPWNTTSIVVSASLLEPTEVTVYHPSKRREEVVLASIKKDRQLETLAIPVREMVQNGSIYTLRILYTGRYNSTGGLFRATYNNRNFVSTQLYPSYTRRVFISLDKPGNVVPIKLTVKTTTPSKDVKVYSGLDQAAAKSGGTELTTKKNIPLSAVFFTVGPYKQLSGNPFWYPDGWSVNTINFYTATDVLGAAYIRTLYTAANMSAKAIAVPGLPVASESGLGMTALSMDLARETSEFSTYELKEKAIRIITAVVKSIYATLVSPSTWYDIWISESTSLYIAQKVLPNLTRWKDMKGITPDTLNVALSQTWSSDSMPVRPNFTSTEQVVAYLKDPAVAKGAVILGMVDSLRPDDDLLAFTSYLKDRQGKSVTTDDFLAQLADYKQLNQTENFPNGQTLQDILSPWLSEPGYPALILERRDTDILASEMRYGPQNMSDKSGWTLPIQYQRVSNSTAANDGPESAWLVPGPNAEVTLEKGLDSFSTVLLNTQSAGLYRTLYDAGDLSVLANILSDSKGNNIKPSWRANILRDAFAFAKSGQLSYSSLIDFCMYLSGERDMEPWVATISGLRELWMYVYFTDLKVQFENVFGDLMRPTYASLSFTNTAIVTGMLMRSLVSAHCDFGDQDCLDDTRAAFINYVNGKQKNFASDLIPVIYCNGLRGITKIDELMTYVTKQYNSSSSEYSKKNVFSYLACPADNSTMNAYLNNILTRPVVESMPPEDMVMAFEEVASRPEHLDLSFSFVVRNFASLNKALKEEHKIRLIKILGERGSTETHVEVLNGFTFGNSSAMSAAVSDALKQVQERQRFISDNYYQIETGLYGRPVGPSPSPHPTGPTGPTPPNPSEPTPPTPSTTPSGAERASITALATTLLATLALLAR